MRAETHCEFVVMHIDNFLKVVEKFPKAKQEYNKIGVEIRRGNPRPLRLKCKAPSPSPCAYVLSVLM